MDLPLFFHAFGCSFRVGVGNKNRKDENQKRTESARPLGSVGLLRETAVVLNRALCVIGCYYYLPLYCLCVPACICLVWIPNKRKLRRSAIYPVGAVDPAPV